MIYFWVNKKPITKDTSQFRHDYNLVCRGKNITSYGIEGIHQRIVNNFDDLYISDYFKITITTSYGGTEDVWMNIADFNYLLNVYRPTTKKIIETPHLVLIPYYPLKTKHKMNNTATTNGGFAESYMGKTVLPVYKTAFNNALNNHLMEFTAWDTGGGGTGAETRKITLPTQEMITGVSSMSYNKTDCLLFQRQLAIFTMRKDVLHNPINEYIDVNVDNCAIWLQNIASSTEYVNYFNSGSVWTNPANEEHYIKPIMFMC